MLSGLDTRAKDILTSDNKTTFDFAESLKYMTLSCLSGISKHISIQCYNLTFISKFIYVCIV